MSKRLSSLAEDVANLLHDLWRLNIVHVTRTLHWIPVVVGVVALWLFGVNGQLREAYLRIMESADWPRFLAGLASIAVIASALFISQIRLTYHRALAVYGSVSNIQPDAWFLNTRELFGVACASLPFLGLLWGLWHVEGQAHKVAYLTACAGIGILVLAALWLNRRKRSIGRRAVTIGGWLLLFIFLTPLMAPAVLLPLALSMGPVALVGLQFIAVLSVLAFLARLPAWIPGARWIPVALIVALVAHQVLTQTGSSTATDDAQSEGPSEKVARDEKHPERPQAEQIFKRWLDARGPEIKAFNGKYPVFIVAAQGGGIHAASAAANFLATLQDDCPSFARHIFAISGVSGGSVGAAVYAAAIDGPPPVYAAAVDRLPSAPPGCREHPANGVPGPIESKVGDILTRDHLSPVLALLVPEIAYAMLLDVVEVVSRYPVSLSADGRLPFARGSRATALETSLACGLPATPQTPQTFGECIASESRSPLRRKLTWEPSSGSPALILNTTLSEAGSIVAFSPFPLADLGEVEAFMDQPYGVDPGTSELVMAAVASARFPGVLPPYPRRETNGRQRNFVDGAYADVSGVATAGAIYKALNKAAAEAGVDLRLILLTGDDARTSRHQLGYSTWADLRVPIEALLNVQSGIGTREVVRALNQFAHSGEGEEEQRVLALRVPTTFLGWTISRKTNDLIAKEVAAVTPCLKPDKRKKQLEDIADSRKRALEALRIDNGCTLSRIRKLLTLARAT